MITTLQYEIGYGYDRNISEGVSILYNMSDNVSQIKITGILDEIELLLGVLLIKEQVNLKTLIIIDSFLNTYLPPIAAVVTVRQNIDSITFCKCKIKFTALKSFMKEFRSLDYVKFDNCAFDGGSAEELMDLSDTMIGTMYMSNFHKMTSETQYHDNYIQNVIIVSAYLATLNCTKYFMVVEGSTVKISKAIFDLFTSKLNNNEIAVLRIGVKSMKQLLLRLTDSSKEIKITFPQ